MTQGLRSTLFVILLWVWFCGCLTGSYWGVYKAWFPSCSDIGLIFCCVLNSSLFAFLFLNISSVCIISVNLNPHWYKKKTKTIFMSAVPWCILVVCCTCANNAFLRSFKYQNGGLWRWHAWAHPFRAREQKELEFKGLALKIARWKRPGVWKWSASVNSAIKMVIIFSSAGIFKSEENLGIIGHWVTTAISIFF